MRASVAAAYPGLPTLRVILTGQGGITATELADYVAHLPPGCALWRQTGGANAWSDEVHMTSLVLNGLDILAWQNTGIMTRNPKGTQPAPMKPPRPSDEVRADEARLDSKRERRDLRRAARAKLRATE